MRLRLPKLQETDNKVQMIRAEGTKDAYKEFDGVLYYQGLSFVPEAIRLKLISQYHNDSLAGHFGIHKTRELIGRKYYWPSLNKDVEAYIKGYDICLGSKAVRNKPYGNF